MLLCSLTISNIFRICSSVALSMELGSAYRHGRGVTRDETEAARWYRKSAEAGNAEAMALLVRMHQANPDLPAALDTVLQAVAWLKEHSS